MLNAGWKSAAVKEVGELFGKKLGKEIAESVSDDMAETFLKYARKLPPKSVKGSNTLIAGKFVSKYGDDAVKILSKHGDTGINALKNGGDWIANPKVYNKMSDGLFKYAGKRGKGGIETVKKFGVDISNTVVKQFGDNGLLKIGAKVRKPHLLKKALAKVTGKKYQRNILENAMQYGDEFLQFSLQYKKQIIFAGLIGYILAQDWPPISWPPFPDSLEIGPIVKQFDKGFPVIKNNHVDLYLKVAKNKNTNTYKVIQKGIKNYEKYGKIIEKILDEYDLPKELVALAIQESGLDPSLTSPVGAAGMWQFMKGTAIEYGLKVNSIIDERRDIIKSTHAACKYLKYHYNKYDDWYLAMAAYNYGQKKTDDWIKIFGTNDFWELAKKSKENGKYGFPPETRNYIPKILAIMIIMDDPDKYNHTIQDFRTVAFYQVQKGDSLSLIAQKYNINVNELKKANSKIKNINKIYPNQIVEIPNQS